MSAQRDNLLKQCPCAKDRWPKCPHGWHLAKRHDGKRYAVSLDKYAKRRGLPVPRLRGDAEKLAERIAKEIETGTYQEKPAATSAPPAAAEASDLGLTVDQAWPKFATSVLGGTVSKKSEESRLRTLGNTTISTGRFGDLLLAAVTESDIEEVFAAAGEDYAESTKKKVRRNLKRLFRWAAKKGHIPVSPITEETIMRVGKGTMRTRRVKPDEEANLLEAAREGRSDAAWRLVAVILAALDTGLRLGELLALQWRDILWEERRVEVRAVELGAQKTRAARTVPMTPRVLDLLWTLAGLNPTGTPWPDAAYVFGDAVGGRVTTIRKAWVTAVLRAHNVMPAWTGTALAADARAAFAALDLHFHDLRHECALRWLEKGYTLGTIAALLGHDNLDTLKVYLGVTGREALADAERLNRADWVVAEAAPGPAGSKPAVKPAGGRLLTHKPKEGTRRQVAG